MPVSAAQKRATTKFEHNTYDKITLRLRKDDEITREAITIAADAAGESVNAYILRAVRERMKKES